MLHVECNFLQNLRREDFIFLAMSWAILKLALPQSPVRPTFVIGVCCRCTDFVIRPSKFCDNRFLPAHQLHQSFNFFSRSWPLMLLYVASCRL